MLLYHLTWKDNVDGVVKDGIRSLKYIIDKCSDEIKNKVLEKYKKRYSCSPNHKIYDKAWYEVTTEEALKGIIQENGDIRYIYCHKFKPPLGNNKQSDTHLKQTACIGFDYTQLLKDGYVQELRSKQTVLSAQELLSEDIDFFYKKDGKHFTMFASLVPHFGMIVKKDIILPEYIKEISYYD